MLKLLNEYAAIEDTSFLTEVSTRCSRSLETSLNRGVVHEMRIPRITSGGAVAHKVEQAFTFPRAVIIDALLDAKDANIDVSTELIKQECNKLIAAKRKDVSGGWSYFSNVPELPPDMDDLGSVTRTLFRAGGSKLAACCSNPLDICLASLNADGSRSTWIIDPESYNYAVMLNYMKIIARSEGCHAEVIANFISGAYIALDDGEKQQKLLLCVDFLLKRQQANGSWRTNFYGSTFYSTMMVLTALKSVGCNGPGINAAICFLESSQQDDGSWFNGDVLATACAIISLVVAGEINSAVRRGLKYLLKMQREDGLWPAGTFVRVVTPFGIIEQKDVEITSAFCLKAITTYLLEGRLAWFNNE